MKRILDAKRKITGTRNVELKLICFIVLLTVISFSEAHAENVYYALVMSKNDNVCQHMLSIYNEDLKQFTWDCNAPFDETNLISIRKYKSDNSLEDACYYIKAQIIDTISQPKPPEKGGQQ